MADADKPAAPAGRSYGFPGSRWLTDERAWYVAAIVIGAVAFVVTAINQPYNQNELVQMKPYGSDDLSTITSGTRQPPLDPLLGAAVQHVLGVGQLRQHLVPVIAGTGTLVIMALLLRHLRLGIAGAVGLWVLATAPLMLRYSAYTRPYALPMFLMVLFVYATQRWLDGRRTRWLGVTAIAAIGLPLARVPEPTLFLLATGFTLGWLTYRRKFSWAQTWPLIVIAAVALLAIAYPMFRSLNSRIGSGGVRLGEIFDRYDDGLHELIAGFVPLLGSWFPWWPVTVLVLLAAGMLSAVRRRLLQWWFFWPLLVTPVLWALAYHILSPYSFQELPYRPRAALFFVPVYALIIVALVAAVIETKSWTRTGRAAVAVLLTATLLGQLPTSGRVLVENEAADYGQVAEVLTQSISPDAIVLYSTVAPVGYWHQPFSARPRYMGKVPYVGRVSSLMLTPHSVPKDGPVYVLMLDSACAYSTLCNEPPQRWDEALPGWRVARRFDRFTLYEPDATLAGRRGVIVAMRNFAQALGPDFGYAETFTAAALLKLQGHSPAGRALIRRMYAGADPDVARRIRMKAEEKDYPLH